MLQVTKTDVEVTRIIFLTSQHSSRMRTARLPTIRGRACVGPATRLPQPYMPPLSHAHPSHARTLPPPCTPQATHAPPRTHTKVMHPSAPPPPPRTKPSRNFVSGR